MFLKNIFKLIITRETKLISSGASGAGRRPAQRSGANLNFFFTPPTNIVKPMCDKKCHISSHFLSCSCIFAHISTASRPIRPIFLQPVGPSVKSAHKKFQPDRPIRPRDTAPKPAAGRTLCFYKVKSHIALCIQCFTIFAKNGATRIGGGRQA